MQSSVSVCNQVSKKWDEPLKFVQIDGKVVVAHSNRGRKLFCSLCVKLLKSPRLDAFEAGRTLEANSGFQHV